MLRITLIIFIFFLSNTIVKGQEHNHDDHEHHTHPKNEIGVANAPVYYLKEKEFTYGLHFHFIRTIGESKFGLGLGYEQIFDEHEHKTIGIVGCFRPTHGLSINLSPGLTFEKHIEDDGTIETEKNLGAHLESAYEWDFGNLHIGPVVEFAYDQEDIHISLGLHIGYGF